jgi:hypothetical protein
VRDDAKAQQDGGPNQHTVRNAIAKKRFQVPGPGISGPGMSDDRK